MGCYIKGKMSEVSRGGRSWLAMEAKSFEIVVEVEGGKLIGNIWERCRGVTSWNKFVDASLQCLLGGVEAYCRDNGDRKWALNWEERGRKYRLEHCSNKVGRFLLCSVCDLRAKKILYYCSRKKGTAGGVEHSGEEIEEAWSVASWRCKVSTHPRSSAEGEGGGIKVVFGGY